ncbi:MAG: bifunctional phosphoribosylaminoimidazolecarboxamide formyltransferase/IMP cyclohydrolase [Acidimicrobiia bacterium]
MSRVAVRRALLSVSDKRGLEGFARRLAGAGVELICSGGTAEALRSAGLAVTEVTEVTGFPEILGGRVKTLHPSIHGGVLADPADEVLGELGIEPFQLVVVDLYPFEEAPALETIDIGGSALLRAAAKNHAWVGAVSSPDQYGEVAEAVESGGLEEELRLRLAHEAFGRTAAYDATIWNWLKGEESLPERLVLPLRRIRLLRYGENPHQPAAAYLQPGRAGWWATARQRQGKELSFNNLVDAEAAWRLVGDFDDPAVVIVKHTNPCGVAERDDLTSAYRAAWECDPLSAFGGVVAVNRPLDEATAKEIRAGYLEVVVAPEISGEALEVLAARKGLRLLEAPLSLRGGWEMRGIEGGILIQQRDSTEDGEWSSLTRPPGAEQWSDLRFAWKVAASAKSNAVVVARERAAVGVGAGEQSRVGAAQRAVAKAGERAGGAVAAADAFFPFRDGIDVLADAGVRAVVAPSGSRRDEEVIAAARERDVALVFAGRRHFRH